MSDEIQRYDNYWSPTEDLIPDDRGDYVLYEDHQKEVARLREALEKIAKKSVTMIPMRIAKEALDG